MLITLTSEAAELSTQEQGIRRFIIEHEASQMALLEKLVNTNSGTTNIKGVRNVGEQLKNEFAQLGFTTRWVEMPANMKRAGALIAEHTGSNGKKILLIGHLDTVFPSHSSFQQFKRKGNVATGPGVIDMKGGDVVILYALKALQSIRALDGASITVILTGDEEDSGKPTTLSRKALLDVAKDKDLALDFEWAIGLNAATIARRGISNWTIEAKGKDTHSSEIFQPKTGDGAIFELTRILNTMRTELSHEKYLSFSPGMVLGGTTVSVDKTTGDGTAFGKKNVVAQSAYAQGDLRFISDAQKNLAKEKITAIVSQHLTLTSATVQWQDAIPAMPPTARNLHLLQLYSQVSQDLGYGEVKPLDPGLRGAGDISHVASVVPACLAGLGLEGTGAHSEHETLNVKSMVINTQRAALLIYRLTR